MAFLRIILYMLKIAFDIVESISIFLFFSDPEDWKEKFLQIKALDLENFAKSFKYAKKIGAISS